MFRISTGYSANDTAARHPIGVRGVVRLILRWIAAGRSRQDSSDHPASAEACACLLRAAELLFGNDPLDIVGLASDAVPQASIGLDRHAADDRVNVRPALFSAALRSLALVMNVFVYRKVVRHGISDHGAF